MSEKPRKKVILAYSYIHLYLERGGGGGGEEEVVEISQCILTRGKGRREKFPFVHYEPIFTI